MIHLFLSPHFDDAPLSCGGTIHHLVQAGKKVMVRTVMGGIPNLERLPDTPMVRELHTRWERGTNPVLARIAEDEKAIASLGADYVRMGVWTDCIYRAARDGAPFYAEWDKVIGEIQPDDPAGKLAPLVVLPADEPLTCIYAPLGAGHHVDHQIIRNWGLMLKVYMPWVALKFYEEYPYTQDPEAVNRALEYFRTLERAPQMTSEVINLTEANVQAKVTSIACYESQISSFWSGLAEMEAATHDALQRTGNGVPGERFWVWDKKT
ncbi:MAG: PIG-L family deacetylase [Anaerolineae bacterium]